MTTADLPAPILEPIVGDRPVVVEAPVAVGVQQRRVVQPTRADRRDLAAKERAVEPGWIFDGVPPGIADVVRVRMVTRPPVRWLRHRCFDRTGDSMVEVDGGWSCACDPATDEVRKSYTTRIRVAKSIRIAWITYNHIIGIPATVLLYLLAWLIQHPGRLLLSASVVLFVIGVIST